MTIATTNGRFRAAQLRARKLGFTDRRLAAILGVSYFSVRNWASAPGSTVWRPCPENVARQCETLFPPDCITGFDAEAVRDAMNGYWD